MPEQISRLIIIFVVLIAGLLAARTYLVPETFGEQGHYRTAAVDSALAQPIHYAGQEVCGECHDEIYATKLDSRHQGVACEVCHGPAADHVEDSDTYVPEAPRERGYCPLCHGYNASRPTGFPQIDPMSHNPAKACIECHDAHNPVTPHIPEDCSACHGEIARSKAVSHHASLDCVRCHTVMDEHKDRPRQFRAEKPRNRALCGECHAEGADVSKTVPTVDMDGHGNGYTCWQCHYPHRPEVE